MTRPRVLLDACVLVPATTRGLLLGAAEAGFFTPLWSPMILAEWSHAARRYSEAMGAQAATEQALMTHRFPEASVPPLPNPEVTLPDRDDEHVLASAVAGQADELLTANISDFPIRVLAAFDILRRHPDEFLLELAQAHPAAMTKIAQNVLMSLPDGQDARRVFKKSGLNRFAKHMSAKLG